MHVSTAGKLQAWLCWIALPEAVSSAVGRLSPNLSVCLGYVHCVPGNTDCRVTSQVSLHPAQHKLPERPLAAALHKAACKAVEASLAEGVEK
jgi:hypothetical protein